MDNNEYIHTPQLTNAFMERNNTIDMSQLVNPLAAYWKKIYQFVFVPH